MARGAQPTNKLYFYDTILVSNFEEGKDFCDEKGGILATISTRETFDFVAVLLGAAAVENAYIGLGREPNIDLLSVDEFTFVDGKGNSSFYSVAGQFPWREGRPNNNNNKDRNNISKIEIAVVQITKILQMNCTIS